MSGGPLSASVSTWNSGGGGPRSIRFGAGLRVDSGGCSSTGLIGGAVSGVRRSCRRLRLYRLPQTSTSQDLFPKALVQVPRLYSSLSGSRILMACPHFSTTKGRNFLLYCWACFAFRSANLMAVSWWDGCLRSIPWVGRNLRVRRPSSLCISDVPRPSVGVLRQSSRANRGSCPSTFAFFIRDLQVFTAFSARPFDWG